MNYEGFSGEGLKMMHDAVHRAIEVDRAAIADGKDPPCGTNTYADWRAHAKGLEDTMRAKGVEFVPVKFIGE